MKKNLWAAGALTVVLLAAAGGWLVIHAVEAKTGRAVRDVLAALSVSADRVDYSLLDNTLNLTNVTFAWERGALRSSGRVEHIRVTGFDRACLKASAGAELPLVADSLVATHVEITDSFQKMVSRESIAEIRLEGWYQNLGKLAALYRQAGLSEDFFAEAYHYRLEMLACKDSHVVLTNPGQNDAITISRAMYGLLGPAGSRSAAAEDGRTLSLFINDARTRHRDGDSHAERVEVHDLRLPSPAGASRLAGLMEELQAIGAAGDPGDPLEALLDIGETMAAEMVEDYWGSTPYKEIVMRGFSVEARDGQLRLDEMRHQLSLADPLVFGLELKGLHGSWDAMSEEWRRAGSAFLADGPLLDGSLSLSLRSERRPSSVAWSTGVRDLGRAKGSFSLELSELSTLALSTDWLLANIHLKDAEAVYSDQGLAALVLAVSALYGRNSVEQEWSDLKASLPALSEDAGEIGSMLEKAAAAMLERPGTLRVRCRPERPLPLGGLLITLLLQPESLNLDVTAEPGDKSLLDWIPSSLRH
ncbi:MAG: hypothetical protein J1E80_01345 [Desulfovibrionaceae bacterium]|nr:hypothetical protein [Desulfovibrionaceae bacterium]